jgi:hypothetical protein
MPQAVSKSPLNALQSAVVAKLKADSALVALLGGRQAVYDQPPEAADGGYPYVRIGDHLSIPDNDLSTFGRQITMTLHIWTKARTSATGQAIADRITALLDHKPAALTVTGHDVVSIRNEFDQALTDPDPEIRHHVLRFRVITAQQS